VKIKSTASWTSGRASYVCLALGVIAMGGRPAAAGVPVQRFTLVIGANFGGAERPRLQYAVSDAERFARVLVDLGGVPPANEIVLKQPKLHDLLDALNLLSARVTEARRAGSGRTEVLLYYSGHADEHGLLIGDDRYSYRTLRDRLDQIPADVRIAVLDACASGAFTRLKGGKARPAFLVDESATMRGHAFLTSSAETEAAQESDRIRASYFTHYLISGFRGAADLSGDGKVTLNEAYQFAFNETLGRTVDTKGGAQHPSYDINLSGTGDVVMTDVRQTTATIVLGPDLEGRFFIRNAARELVVELYKPRGRQVELGVEAGSYEVRIELPKSSLLAKASVSEDSRIVLDSRQFGATTLEPTARRGGPEPARLAVEGRNRVEVRWGMWRVAGTAVSDISVGSDLRNLFNGAQYTRYLRENLALTCAFATVGAQSGVIVGSNSTFVGDAVIRASPIGLRWNPLKGDHRSQSVKPYLAAGLGPVFGASDGVLTDRGIDFVGSRRQATVGGHIGAGVDFHVAHAFSVGVNSGYNWMVDFAQPVGSRDNYSGPELGLSFGWLFGKGRAH
jgi:Caspase domain